MTAPSPPSDPAPRFRARALSFGQVLVHARGVGVHVPVVVVDVHVHPVAQDDRRVDEVEERHEHAHVEVDEPRDAFRGELRRIGELVVRDRAGLLELRVRPARGRLAVADVDRALVLGARVRVVDVDL